MPYRKREESLDLPFGDRNEERRQLQTLLDEPDSNPAGCLLAGSPGIGKSSLCKVLADHGRANGYLILYDSAQPQHADVPLGNLLVLLRRAARREQRAFDVRNVKDLDSWISDRWGLPLRRGTATGMLASSLDGVGDVLLSAGSVSGLLVKAASGGVANLGSKARRNVRRELSADPEGTTVEYLSYLAQSGPVAFLLDDFHWMDASSVHVIARFLQRKHAEQVALIFGFRPYELSQNKPARALTAVLYEEGFGELLLEPLPTDALLLSLGKVAKGLDPNVVGEIAANAEGNPLLAEWDLRVRLRAGPTSGAGRSAQQRGVDTKQHRALTSRISELSLRAKNYLQIGSCIGFSFSFRDVHQVLHLLAERTDLSRPGKAAEIISSIELQAIQDEIEALDFVVVSPGEDLTLRFKHPLIREFIYEDVPKGKLLTLHTLLAEVLRRRAEAGELIRPGELGRHYREARDYRSAFIWFLKAGSLSYRSQNYVHAAGQMEAALECLEGEAGSARSFLTNRHRLKCQLIIRLVECSHRGGDFVAAQELASQGLLKASTEGFDLEQALLEFWMGKTEYFVGDDDFAVSLYEDASRIFRRLSSKGHLARTITALSASLVQIGKGMEAAGEFEEALTIAQELETTNPKAAVEVYQHSSMVLTEQVAAKKLKRAIELAKQQTWTRLEGLLWHNYGVALYYLGKITESEQAFNRALELHLKSGSFEIVYTLNSLGVMNLIRSRLHEAGSYFGQAADRTVADFDRIWIANNRAVLSHLQGRTEEAIGTLEPLLPKIASHSDPVIRENSYFNLGILYFYVGRSGDAKRLIRASINRKTLYDKHLCYGKRYAALARLLDQEGQTSSARRLRAIADTLLHSDRPESWTYREHEFVFCHLRNYH